MTKIGMNLRMSASADQRDAYDRILIGVFGCESVDVNAQMRIYAFPGGGKLGVVYLEGDAAAGLPSADVYREFGTWIEIVSDAAEAKIAAVIDLGYERAAYTDTVRSYFQLPGGQVYRISAPGQV